jgi:hypothetical protein
MTIAPAKVRTKCKTKTESIIIYDFSLSLTSKLLEHDISKSDDLMTFRISET